ncbi:MAG TPA: extracellular solute-binding protein [Candidatus Binatia bacterium]|nr:extracellular solute-binding protein [Candidatus Binatia bacterium]
MKLRELIGIPLVALILTGGQKAQGAEALPGSEQDWERTVKAAEQEGQVVVYKIAHDAEWHAFQKKFPKIKVSLIQGNAAQLQQRLLAERRAGKFLADVVRLGGGTSTSLYKAKALDPIAPALMLAEVKDPSRWLDGKHHYNDIDNQYVFVYAAFPLHLLGYNQKLVDPKTLTSYGDLLDPKWRGKITLKDPKEPGGQSPLLFLYHNPQLGPDYLKKLFGVAELTLVRNDRQQTDWLAAGKYPLTLTSKATEVEEAKTQGLPVDMLDAHAFKKEGVALEAGGTMLALMNKAPHPNAAKVLINWFLSREGQMAIQKTGPEDAAQNSLREDIPKENLRASLQRQKGTKYVRLWGAEVWDRESVAKFVNDLVK